MLVMKVLTYVSNEALESYLYESVESHSVSSSDNSEDDSQDNQRLLSTTRYRNVNKLVKHKISYLFQ